MTLQKLLEKTFDRVTIYRETGVAKYTDLFTGEPKGAPTVLLNKQVRVFGADEKGHIDIEIIM